MPIRLISLVLFLLFSIFTQSIFSNEIILPKEKPSVFKKIERNINKNTQIVPSKKPVIKDFYAPLKNNFILLQYLK